MTNNKSVTYRSNHVHRIWTPRHGTDIHALCTSDQTLVLCDIFTLHDAEVRPLR